MVSSNGSANPIIWVLEPNVYRSASLVGSAVHPQLHAIDGTTMQLLFSSDPNDPDMRQGGKYNHPLVARGVVFTGTDRIAAWGLLPTTLLASRPARGVLPASATSIRR
jgi:hypothetical protein